MRREEIIKALEADDFSEYYNLARDLTRKHKGNEILIRAIIEYSSFCVRACAYCGLNCFNDKATRYRMTEKEIIETAFNAINVGYKTIVLQGGEDPLFIDGEILANVTYKIKSNFPDVAVTISAGELSDEVIKKIRDAGANRYLLRHETSDRENYKKLHPDSCFEDRYRKLKVIKKLGYETGSGFMVGLPNQSIESIADDLLVLKGLECEMAGMGPFISHPETSLANCENGSAEMTLRCVAIARILLPDANLPVTTAVGVLNSEMRQRAFLNGANVIMRKVNPEVYKKAYELYPGDLGETNLKKERMDLEKMIRSVGLIPV